MIGLIPPALSTLHRSDLLMLPAYASSIVITYRLSVLDYDRAEPVTLSRQALAGIFNGMSLTPQHKTRTMTSIDHVCTMYSSYRGYLS